MIDWYNLLMNVLWIIAAALALAALSYANWQASVKKEKFRTVVGQPGVQTVLNIAGILFSAGLAGTSDILWQRILWIVLAIGFAVQIGLDRLRLRGKENEGSAK